LKRRRWAKITLLRERGASYHEDARRDLEKAIGFEKMAAEETDPNLKEDFEKQTAAYRKLAEKRAKNYGLAPS
jgi:hypothetical protein